VKEYGVYRLEPTSRIEASSTKGIHPDNGDVTINEPDIYLLPWNNRWVVACGGHWNNNNWLTSSLSQNIRDADAFGVGYTHTNGDYRSLVTASSAWISDESGEKKSTTANRSDGDGALGFGFRLQDYIFDKSILASNKGYVGYKWAGDVTYDDWFGSYSFIATSYYIHTYSTATLDSITFGIQGANKPA